MTRRRWIADTWTLPDSTSEISSPPATASLTGDQAAHLARVLRAQPGQIYDVVAGGFLHRAEITNVSNTEVLFTLHEELQSDAALPLHLLLAIFKFDHMEWAIEKATELGIGRITPILARRTEKHLAQSAAKRADRWRRIAFEAAKQSRRTDVPEIIAPTALQPALEQETSPTRILLSETEQATTLTDILASTSRNSWPAGNESFARNETGDPAEYPVSMRPSPIGSPATHAIAIGPEGGWTPEEMSLFTQYQWQPATLGPRILRAETAAVAAIAIISAHLT